MALEDNTNPQGIWSLGLEEENVKVEERLGITRMQSYQTAGDKDRYQTEGKRRVLSAEDAGPLGTQVSPSDRKRRCPTVVRSLVPSRITARSLNHFSERFFCFLVGCEAQRPPDTHFDPIAS